MNFANRRQEPLFFLFPLVTDRESKTQGQGPGSTARKQEKNLQMLEKESDPNNLCL